jgi:hypothetical protein
VQHTLLDTMRLQLATPTARHSELASGVSWHATGDMLSTSDDGTVQRWSGRGECLGKVITNCGWRAAGGLRGCRAHPRAWACQTCAVCLQVCVVDSCTTDIHCFPLASRKQQQLASGNDVFVLACADGERCA